MSKHFWGNPSCAYSRDIGNSANVGAHTIPSMLVESRDGLVYSPGIWKNLILDFTLSFLITNPKDLITFGLEYFENLRTKKYMMNEDQNEMDFEDENSDDDDALGYMYMGGWKDEMYKDERRTSATTQPPPRIRRKSVFADPNIDEDDDETWMPPVHPKTDEQRRNCKERMREVMLFREINPEDLSQLVDGMVYKEVEPGQKIIVQAEDGDYFYIVDSGLYEAYLTTVDGVKGIAKYNNNGSFGELALMYNVPRTCSVKALTRGGLWALDRDTFKRVVVKGAKRKRSRYMNFLHKVPLLKSLNEYEMLNLADSFLRISFNVGERIILQGEEADGMYFIEEGSVGVSRIDENGKEIGLQELNVGDYFGELALIENQPRAASAYAMSDVKLAFLCAEAFERLMGSCRELMARRASEYRKDLTSKSRAGDVLEGADLIQAERPQGALSILKRDRQEIQGDRKSIARDALTNVRVVDPDDDDSEDDKPPTTTKRRSTGRSLASRASRVSKFYDRKPSLFKILPEIMQNTNTTNE